MVQGELISVALDDDVVRRTTGALWNAGADGLTRTQLRDHFSRNVSGAKIRAALELLRLNGMARCEIHNTGGRPSEVWHAYDQSACPDTNLVSR